MSLMQIPLSVTPFEPNELATVLASYEGLPQMKGVLDFENAIAGYIGVKHALAVNSGTAAIHLALRAVGVGPGDEVMVSTFTYVATVNPIIYLGATPVFIDSEETTWNMDPSLLEKAIIQRINAGRSVKGILVVHAYGMPAKMKEIGAISSNYGIPLIEDAAEALGSTFSASKLGAIGDVGIFSFNNNKIITTYGGGALVTDNFEVYQNALKWSSQAREDKSYYEHKETGYSYRMGPLNAIYGMYAMSQVHNKITERRSIYDSYKLKLQGSDEFDWVDELSGSFSNRWLTTILKKRGTIQPITDVCKSRAIETRLLWKPMHLQPVFKDAPAYINGVSEGLFEKGICLPSGSAMTVEQQDLVIASILETFNKNA
jgi:pyridoxal phosphate-dependent aminotransferase EpsN